VRKKTKPIPVITLLGIAACGLPSATGQQRSNPELLALINKIKAIDNHCHDLPAPDPKHNDNDLPDPLGKSPDFFDARQRENHPRWVQAWRALYGYTRQDLSLGDVGELFKIKQRVMRDKALNYPAWVLDQAAIEIALVNAPQLGLGQTFAPLSLGSPGRWLPVSV
jgi:hypothetical protein